MLTFLLNIINLWASFCGYKVNAMKNNVKKLQYEQKVYIKIPKKCISSFSDNASSAF